MGLKVGLKGVFKSTYQYDGTAIYMWCDPGTTLPRKPKSNSSD